MKYLTKRQRKRRVDLFNRFGKICYPIDSDVDSEVDAENLATTSSNRKLPLSRKTIAKDVFKSKYHHQSQQQPLPDGTNYRRVQFGFGSCSFPSWLDRNQDRRHHHAEPLTLGSFMDIELLSQLFGKRDLQSPRAATVSNNHLELTQPQRGPIMSWCQDVSVHDMLSHLAMTTPYKELANLTLSMLQNTAFGPVNTGSRSTAGNIPYIKHWPNPYQICYRYGSEPQHHQHLHQFAEIMPVSAMKPIGYETKGKYPLQQQQKQEHPNTYDLWLRQNCIRNININMIDPNPNSIVESIKCICKRNIQWDNWQQFQYQRNQRKEPGWDRRSRSVINHSRFGGQYIMAPVPEYYQQQRHGQQMIKPATSAAISNTNYNMRHSNKNNINNSPNFYNDNNNRMHYQQHQQHLHPHHQQQHMRYNYQNQQQQQQLGQQQPQNWSWKLRQQYHNRFYKGTHCKQCFNNLFYNNNNNNSHIHHNCSNIDPFLLNLSQKDLDAAQMYAIYGERFFDMPMGTRYKTPTVAAAALTAMVSNPIPSCNRYHSNGHFQNWHMATTILRQQPMSGGVVNIAARMPILPTPLSCGPPLIQQGQVMAPVYSGSNQYAANFPPLPAPNQRRDDSY